MSTNFTPNVMIDIETLGTSPNSVIATIGAMKFSRKGILKPINDMYSFYRRINLDSCYALGMVSDEETIKWWEEQEEKSREEIYDSSNRISIEQALQELSEFIGNNNNTYIWANGPHFDCVILENAFKKCNINLPWKYWNIRDCRTIYDFCNIKLRDINGDYQHNALYDCYRQIYALKLSFDKFK